MVTIRGYATGAFLRMNNNKATFIHGRVFLKTAIFLSFICKKNPVYTNDKNSWGKGVTNTSSKQVANQKWQTNERPTCHNAKTLVSLFTCNRETIVF